MERVILHVDANSFYASVECVYRPELKGKAVSVCGDPEARHGIVLTSTIEAKKRGVKTGMAIWQARQVCPELIVVPPDYALYTHFSEMMRGILEEYSLRVEPFGLDESWVDVSAPDMTIAEGEKLANRIRIRIREELGITVSVGVSFNKIFAKLGSDMKKPDAVTVLSVNNFRAKTWQLPAEDLLYVGSRTGRKLRELGILTIGDLACAPESVLLGRLGKNGLMLRAFARGEDMTPVAPAGMESVIKSIGNSCTAPRDIITPEDAHCVLYLLAESVGTRLREHGFRTQNVAVSIRTSDLVWSSHQYTLREPTCVTDEIARAGWKLFAERYQEMLPLRSMGVHCGTLSSMNTPVQMDLLGEQEKRSKALRMDQAADALRKRFGHQAVQHGVILTERLFAQVNPKEEHTIHPVSFLKG